MNDASVRAESSVLMIYPAPMERNFIRERVQAGCGGTLGAA